MTFTTPVSSLSGLTQILSTPTSDQLTPWDTSRKTTRVSSTLPSNLTVAVLTRGDQLFSQQHNYISMKKFIITVYILIISCICRINPTIFSNWKAEAGSHLRRIRLHCTAQSTKPTEHEESAAWYLYVVICLFKQITTDFISSRTDQSKNMQHWDNHTFLAQFTNLNKTFRNV